MGSGGSSGSTGGENAPDSRSRFLAADVFTRWSGTTADSVSSAPDEDWEQILSLFGRWIFPADGLYGLACDPMSAGAEIRVASEMWSLPPNTP